MSNKPKIFTYTSYRLPSQEDLNEINSSNLSSEEIFEGLCYTIIGRGILNTKHKSEIIESINMLINKFPNNGNYKKALILANELQPRFKSINESNEIKGGKADKLTVKDIAKKFNVPVSSIEKQLAMGKKVEHEHTKDMGKASEIAMDHLTEFPDYYTRLEKMEKEAKKHAKKIEIKEDTKSLIKRLLRENIERPFTENYFKTRIPFLKDYNFFSDMRNQGTVTAQRIVFHKNVEKMYDNSVVVFPQFNPVSNFTYHTDNNGDRTSHRFSLKNSFAIMQPSNMDDLDFRVFLMAMKQMDDKLSYYDEIILRNGEQLSQTVIDKIINGLNEKMFKFEEVANQHNAPLY